jgi:hypothetical protein
MTHTLIVAGLAIAAVAVLVVAVAPFLTMIEMFVNRNKPPKPMTDAELLQRYPPV